LSEAVEKALEQSDGLVKIEDANGERLISAKFMCPYDGFSFPEVEPRLFSFNSPYGACPACNGLGTKHFMGEEPCPVCHGARLRPEALNVFLEKEQGDPNAQLPEPAVRRKEGRFNILELTNLSIEHAYEYFNALASL
jgi:excinuclease UvrABC ATPase subunit